MTRGPESDNASMGAARVGKGPRIEGGCATDGKPATEQELRIEIARLRALLFDARNSISALMETLERRGW